MAIAAVALTTVSCAYRYRERPEIPGVVVQTVGGTELGVATDDGVVFLGRSAIEGPAKVTYWIDRAPIVEAGTVRKLGGSLLQVELDVPLPTVPIDFSDLVPNEDLLMIGADGVSRWSVPVRVVNSDRIEGSAVIAPASVELAPHHVGAGVYRDTQYGMALVGLVKAVATASTGERWILLAGPTELRRALLEPKAAVEKREIRYRADGTRTILQRR
ncbi:MAG: hypothetical protein KDC95_20915 [Planctomycetes bacterium]|nr:hypothetical protein [Planctomycetota bacterium]